MIKPKERFLALHGASPSSPAPAGQWNSFINSDGAQVALEAAFAQFALRLKSQDAAQAAQNFYRLEGARIFMQQLMSVGAPSIEHDIPFVRPLNPV